MPTVRKTELIQYVWHVQCEFYPLICTWTWTSCHFLPQTGGDRRISMTQIHQHKMAAPLKWQILFILSIFSHRLWQAHLHIEGLQVRRWGNLMSAHMCSLHRFTLYTSKCTVSTVILNLNPSFFPSSSIQKAASAAKKRQKQHKHKSGVLNTGLILHFFPFWGTNEPFFWR